MTTLTKSRKGKAMKTRVSNKKVCVACFCRNRDVKPSDGELRHCNHPKATIFLGSLLCPLEIVYSFPFSIIK